MASSRSLRAPLRRTPLAAAVIACAAAAQTPGPTPPAPALQPSPQLGPRGAESERALPVVVNADEIRGRTMLDVEAAGNVELRRGSIVLRADRVRYDQVEGIARASGDVRIESGGNVFWGPELQLQVQRFEGFFLQPQFFFQETGAGGGAARIDFIDNQRARVVDAYYTSCPRDGSGGPAWLLSARDIRMDFEANEGVAEGAVLRFYGVPILGGPVLSFPLSDERKSGWLPPNLNIDNRSGVELGVPFYWNIAPNRDAKLTPTLLTRRGFALDSQFRYLERADRGEIGLTLLPHDRVADSSRHALRFQHEGDRYGIHYDARVLRVSDAAYWKEFPRSVPSLTPRLLPLDLQADRRFLFGGEWTGYARVQHWQVLQDPETLLAPYQRSPQLGVRGFGALPFGLAFDVETELNHFTRPDDALDDPAAPLPTGTRAHLLGSLSRPWRTPGAWIAPKLTLNAAAYAMDDALTTGRRRASRVIPTASVDSGLVFEREMTMLGKPFRQTLEPRLLYVYTPFRAQDELPNFDAAGKDFNDITVFSDNAFAGIDRVSDAHQVTLGVGTRLFDRDSGAERVRLTVAQRVLFKDPRIAPLGPERNDLLLLGSSSLSSKWRLDAALQYRPDSNRVERSVLGARYSPGPFRTLSMGYRLTRDASEQVDLGWQWPVYRGKADGSACGGTLYAVGRTSYSLRDSRLTDSLFGVEYDAGCWIARVVAERLSTGRAEATTRLMLQLELVGLSRLGSNPLRALKDNIPGYRLLREERGDSPSASVVYE